MEEKQNNNVFLGMISFISAVISFFKMFYIFSFIAIVTALIGLRKENSRLISIFSLVIVIIAILLKLISRAELMLPSWLLEGIF